MCLYENDGMQIFASSVSTTKTPINVNSKSFGRHASHRYQKRRRIGYDWRLQMVLAHGLVIGLQFSLIRLEETVSLNF